VKDRRSAGGGRRRRWIARALKYAWAAPCTLVGAVPAVALCAMGARARCVDGVLEVAFASERHRCARVLLELPFSGITLGHVVLAPTHAHQAALRPHERVHVEQYERWGVLFFILYAASSVWQLLRGRRPYLDNHFEVQARARSTDTVHHVHHAALR
jgi:hypothetical protein